MRAAELVTTRPPTLSELMAQQRHDEIPELNLIVKADVQGSIGALVDAFAKLPQDEVRVNVIRSAAGGDHRERHRARAGLERDRDRVQRPPGRAGPRARREGRRRRPHVPRDLRRDRRHPRRALGDALARGAGVAQRHRRGARAVPGAAGGRHRRLLRHQRHDHPRLARPGRPRRRRDLREPCRLAAPVQGRRPRGRARATSAASGSRTSTTSTRAT